MIALSEADDLHEIIRNVERENGRDMADMHAIADEVLAIPVGDPTPAPGTLKAMVAEPVVEPLIVFPPPQHEGWSETADGKFIVPVSERFKPGRHYSVGDLSMKLTRTRYWLAGLTMCFISALVVIGWKW